MTTPAVDALYALREQTQRTISELTRDFQAVLRASTDTNADDEHDPEGSTIAFERAQLTALLDSARRTVAEIDSAIERFEAGSYGRCATCGTEISRERLHARPAARLCLACAS
ncbi:MAG: DnaK suppressor protein, partial [Pseudonocardiales bacterium]|nr:DnaK suppressor protein [Pseudonocardiales bacterium]